VAEGLKRRFYDNHNRIILIQI